MSLYGVIGYHVTLSEGHMIANHPIKETFVAILWQLWFICHKFIHTI